MKMEKLKKYLLENEKTLKDVVREINDWNNNFDNLNYQSNDEDFFNIYFNDTLEAVRAVCYGNYNYTDEYVKFNVYGNLESASEYQVIEEMKNNIDEIIDILIAEKENIYIYDDEFKKLLKNIDKEN